MNIEDLQDTSVLSVVRSIPVAQSAISPVMVTIPKAEYFQLRWEGPYWKNSWQQAIEREQEKEAKIKKLEGQVRDLNQRLYGRKTEKGSVRNEGQEKDPSEKCRRGQQRGEKGHGRKLLKHLPVEEEYIDIGEEDKICKICGNAHKEFPLTEDSEVIEIEVRGYIRRIRRKQYTPVCQCENLPGLITAPSPNRLIERGKYGISIWVEILLNKYLYGNPTHRFLRMLSDADIDLSQGTITGGFPKLVPLFEPLLEAISEQVLSEKYWNVDETNYKVFVKIEGKAGYGWYLWIFRSKSAVFYILDPSRSSQVPKDFFGDDAEGTIVCDRYSAYKKLAKELTKLVLAFCWAHVRRDFLDLSRSYPELFSWSEAWVKRIGLLYHQNKLRLEVIEEKDKFKEENKKLCLHLSEMKKVMDKELKDEHLPKEAGKVLKSLKNHWKGLTRFVGNPEIPMDNNRAENAARGPKVGAKGYYGSGSKWAGQFAALMFTLLMTMKYSGINPRLWLTDYLEACALNGNQPPKYLAPFLPWSMDQQRLEKFKRSGLSPPGQSS